MIPKPGNCAVVVLNLVLIVRGQTPAAPSIESPATGARELVLTAGKSAVIDSAVNIQRVAVANGDIAEAVATTPREIVVNAKAPGETSLIVSQQNGQRQFFDLIVNRRNRVLEGTITQLKQELPDQGITLTQEGDTLFLRGTVRDLNAAERAVAIATTAGKTVNLLRVPVPPTDPQILIKVRFASIDRASQLQLGLNLISTGALNTVGATSTQQFSPPKVPDITTSRVGGGGGVASSTAFTLSNALNIFLFRPDLDLGATIEALRTNNLAEILAEPNVLAINGHSANFLAGGEFPFPTLQGGGAGLGAVTIQFREFGIRIAFTPTITPRGTIRMSVTPEVSSLDFANGLVFQGFTIPALSTRRVQTAVELQSGQSFAIGGLLDNRTIKNLSRIAGLGDIPFLGKLFRSQQLIKNNSELLVVVTPEIVRPIPANQTIADLNRPAAFLPPNSPEGATRHPAMGVTGLNPDKPLQETMPVEQLMRVNQELEKQSQQGSSSYQAAPLMQFVPIPLGSQPATGQPQAPAAPPAPAPAPPKPAQE